MSSEDQVLDGRFQLLSRLGAGGMGSVWLAEDRTLRRTVALKELVPHVSTLNLTESRERALVEARAMARVNHPAIVGIHDLFFTGADPWIVMEYIRGRSLAAIIRDQSLDERAIAAIGLRILSGLHAVHDARIVHRDVKPENIVVGADDRIVLVDFGIAKISGDMRLTARSTVLGTTEYMAPERILGDPGRAGRRSLVAGRHAVSCPGGLFAVPAGRRAGSRADDRRGAARRSATSCPAGQARQGHPPAAGKEAIAPAVRRGSRRCPRGGPGRPRRGRTGADATLAGTRTGRPGRGADLAGSGPGARGGPFPPGRYAHPAGSRPGRRRCRTRGRNWRTPGR